MVTSAADATPASRRSGVATASESAPPTPIRRRRRWRAPLFLFLLALLVRLPGLAHSAHTDELYHVLAAEQYLQEGTLSINGGAPYTRARWFTGAVIASMRLFGENVAAARLPALLSGSLLVPLLFLWVRGAGFATAAWTAALLACFSPVLIGYSQWARFYAPQHVLLLLAAMAASGVAASRGTVARRAGFGVAAAACVLAAMHLQILSVIAAGGLGLFLAVAAISGALKRGIAPARVAAGVAIAMGVGLLVALTVANPFVARMFTLLGHVDTWAAWTRDQYQFYHWWLLEFYPTLWTLFPVFVLLGLRLSWRLTVLATAVFLFALTVQSIAAWKHVRYFGYALPFLFVVVGLGVERVLPALRGEAERLLSSLPGLPARARRVGAFVILGLAGAFILGANHAFIRTARMLARTDIPSYQAGFEMIRAGWAPARQVLLPIADSSAVVIAGRDTPALYYLRRADYTLTREKLIRPDGTRPEFAPDPMVAVPVISQAASVADIIRCNRSGLIVVESWQVGNALMIPPSTWSLIEARTVPLPLDPGWGLVATVWTNPAPDDPAGCGELTRTTPG